MEEHPYHVAMNAKTIAGYLRDEGLALTQIAVLGSPEAAGKGLSAVLASKFRTGKRFAWPSILIHPTKSTPLLRV